MRTPGEYYQIKIKEVLCKSNFKRFELRWFPKIWGLIEFTNVRKFRAIGCATCKSNKRPIDQYFSLFWGNSWMFNFSLRRWWTWIIVTSVHNFCRGCTLSARGMWIRLTRLSYNHVMSKNSLTVAHAVKLTLRKNKKLYAIFAICQTDVASKQLKSISY